MRGITPNCEISVSNSIRQTRTFCGDKACAEPVLSLLNRQRADQKDEARNHAHPMQNSQ